MRQSCRDRFAAAPRTPFATVKRHRFSHARQDALRERLSFHLRGTHFRVVEVHDLASMTSLQQFSPLCDVHHTSMKRMMLEEDSEDIRSYHACERRGCTRIFRPSTGYSDRTAGQFDNSRASAKRCPRCGSGLYLAEVDHSLKMETWECPEAGCDYAKEHPSPSAR